MSIYLKKRSLEQRVANQEVYDRVAKKHKVLPSEVEEVFKHHCKFAIQVAIKQGKAFVFNKIGMLKPYIKKANRTKQ